MAINYDKYIDSKTTHYIANSGSDERGGSHGGAAGDQTGREWQLKPWYNRPWTVVLRYPNPAVGLRIAKLSVAAALNPDIGYDQHERESYWDALVAAGYDPSAIHTKCEEDCTGGVTANVKAAGHLLGIPALEEIPIDTYSGNMKKRFVKAGFRALTAKKYLTSPDWLLPGDILLYESHHAAANITYGCKADRAAVPCKLGDRVLKNGMSGPDVKELQEELIRLGYGCGRWGADGDYGDATEQAVRRFQKNSGVTVDGEFGPESLRALRAALEKQDDGDDGEKRVVKIVGGSCYVRAEPNIQAKKLGTAKEGAKLEYAGKVSGGGWLEVVYRGKKGWVSGKYGRLV